MPTLGEQLDEYERSLPDEMTEIDPYTAQKVYMLVAVVGGVIFAIGGAGLLSGLLLML